MGIERIFGHLECRLSHVTFDLHEPRNLEWIFMVFTASIKLVKREKERGERCETCCSGFDGDMKHLGKTVVFLYAHLCFTGDQSRT